jgi:phytoene dehydrogenase-like protein
LRQNRCFLYHVIGGGTGDWDVPVGGMGALTDALADAARAAGAELVTGCAVTGIDTDAAQAEVRYDGGVVGAGRVLANVAPYELARLLGQTPPAKPEGAQLKINMLLRRLPRLRDPVDPHDAFAGTFHIAEGYTQLERAYREAEAGRPPTAPPAEIYCHTLTDPTILAPELIERGMHTLTLFGLHTPARLFTQDGTRSADSALVDATLAQLDAVLAEPIRDCLATDADGRPCLEVKSPLDLEHELGLPGGHIFHRDLEFPYRTGDDPGPAVRWGVDTGHRLIFCCGAGAVRGGGVSGIGGHNAAMAVLESG